MPELERLDLTSEALDAPHAKPLSVARAGFTGELERISRRRPDVEQVDLHRLYHGT